MVINVNRIEQAISRLDSGAFQSFCEQYLHLNGYTIISSKGSVSGTNITKQGTPDHICCSEDGHFILVEDTTLKGKGLKKKIIGDVEKCIITPKHVLPLNEVERLIYFYNQGLDDESIITDCKKICQSKDIVFEFKGLEYLANDLFNNPIKYSRFSETTLGLDLSWFGVMSITDFVDQNERIKLAPSLNTPFFGRITEREEAVNAALAGRSVLLLGNPGVGKTRFAIEICNALSSNGFATICLKGHSKISIKDLMEAIKSINSRHIIILIDDANEFSQFDSINDVIFNLNENIVFVVTVRKHAAKTVESKIERITTTTEIGLLPFNRKETEEFLERCFGIKNPNYKSLIFKLSKGNQRLIVLAAKLALEKPSIASISDASSLYDEYYESLIHELIGNRELMMTLGVVSFENRLNLNNLDYIVSLFQEIGLSTNSFINECRYLSSIEILEINKDVVCFTDQSFKCFVQKKVFIDNKILSLGLFIKKLFFIHPDTTKDVVNSLLSIFQNDYVYDFIATIVQEIADDNDTQKKEAYLSFLEFFSPLFPMKALKYVVNMMERLESFSDRECVMILSILESLSRTDEINDVIELIFQILNKKHELRSNISQMLVNSFSFKEHSRYYGYYKQDAVLRKFYNALSNASQIEVDVIKSVIPEFVKTHFHYTEGGETRREIRVCQYDLQFDEKVSELRTMAWEIIFLLPDFNSNVEEILLHYGNETSNSGIDERIGISDWIQIEKYVSSYFNASNLKHCVIVEHLADRIPSILDSDTLKPFFSSKCFLLYKEIDDIIRSKSFHDYEHFVIPESFCGRIKNYKMDDFIFLFDLFRKMKTIPTVRNPLHLIPSLFNILEQRNEINLMELAAYCIETENVEESFIVYSLYSVLSKRYSDIVLFAFIKTIDKKYRNNWLWVYFIYPAKQIDDSVLKSFYAFLDTPDTNLTIMGFRNILNLNQYINYDPSFIYKCLSIIAKRYDQAPLMYSNYLKVFFLKEPISIVDYFKNDFKLLFKCYCYIVCDRNGIEDYNGKVLAFVSSLDRSFLENYLLFVQQNKDKIHDPYGRLQSFWEISNYIEFGDYIYNYAKGIVNYIIRDSIFKQFLETLHTDNRDLCKQKMKNWIFHLIDLNKDRREEMMNIAKIFEHIPLDIRPDCIVHYLNVCDDINLFKEIELVPISGSWTGSQIPMLTEKKDYLDNLKNRLNQPKFLRHRIVIENAIVYYKQRIHDAEIEEMMDEWYW